MKKTKNIDLLKFGLFCALLFVVVIEFIMNLSIGSALDLERLRHYLSVITNLAFVDNLITIMLLGVLAFPSEE